MSKKISIMTTDSPKPLVWVEHEKAFVCQYTATRYYLVAEDRVKVLETVERIQEKVR